jgi:hypothetical protein
MNQHDPGALAALLPAMVALVRSSLVAGDDPAETFIVADASEQPTRIGSIRRAALASTVPTLTDWLAAAVTHLLGMSCAPGAVRVLFIGADDWVAAHLVVPSAQLVTVAPAGAA